MHIYISFAYLVMNCNGEVDQNRTFGTVCCTVRIERLVWSNLFQTPPEPNLSREITQECPTRVIEREILIINMQRLSYKETWVHQTQRDARNDWVARFYKKDTATEVENERRGFHKERDI